MSDKQFVTIDGMRVELQGEKNLLEVIRRAGIQMPTFCYHSELSVYGACRMCMVENEKGGLDAACCTPPRDGMNVKTNTPRLRRYRKTILELILANHCRDCTTCPENKHCKLQDLAMRFGIEGVRFPNHAVSTRNEDTSSLSIIRDAGKCILCGDCVRVCNEVQNVGAIDFAFRGSKMKISTAFNVPMAESPCVGCGQCAVSCPTGAISVKDDTDKVWRAIDDPGVRTSVQIAPAVRVAVSREFGGNDAENVMGKIVAALKMIGFDEVYDTVTGADLTVMEETHEFLERIKNGGKLPLISSCCPGWIQYCEKRHPELMSNVSTCKSPMEMFAKVIKERSKNDEKKMFHVAVMPCTAKKFEAAREEFTTDGMPDVDAVITTTELIRMIKESGLIFNNIDPEGVDMPFGAVSGAGVIFGVTGGVTEAVLRRVVEDNSRNTLMELSLAGQRGNDGIKEFDIPYGETSLHICVVSGLGNTEKVLQRLAAGEHFDFIEVMACPGGCTCGGGQPYVGRDERRERGKGLYNADKASTIKRSQDNPSMDVLYNGMLKGREHELLHVEYKTKK